MMMGNSAVVVPRRPSSTAAAATTNTSSSSSMSSSSSSSSSWSLTNRTASSWSTLRTRSGVGATSAATSGVGYGGSHGVHGFGHGGIMFRLERREVIALVAASILALFFVVSAVMHSVLDRAASSLSSYDPLVIETDGVGRGGGGGVGFGIGGFLLGGRGGGGKKGERSGGGRKRGGGRRGGRREARRHRDGEGKRIDGDGTNLDAAYPVIRAEHDALFPPDDVDRLVRFARSLRKREYLPIASSSAADSMEWQVSASASGVSAAAAATTKATKAPYDVHDCPPQPPDGYPTSWPVLDVLGHWNTNDPTPRSHIHQGVCRFDYATEYEKAIAYRRAELPFVIRDDPSILRTVERWNQPRYLTSILGRTRTYTADYSDTNQLLFYRTRQLPDVPDGWKEPTALVDISYPDWLERAKLADATLLGPNEPHWYFRINAKSPDGTGFLFDEMPFFNPTKPNFYMVDPKDARGINCRFGMRGNTAENHYDSSRNFIALFGGERRYLISHPAQCKHLALYPMDHPSARHSAVNWADPDLKAHPQFRDAMVSEVVLQAGDVLYLPTNWFHHIVSLDTNFQCNARSGVTAEYHSYIQECGFKISMRGL